MKMTVEDGKETEESDKYRDFKAPGLGETKWAVQRTSSFQPIGTNK